MPICVVHMRAHATTSTNTWPSCEWHPACLHTLRTAITIPQCRSAMAAYLQCKPSPTTCTSLIGGASSSQRLSFPVSNAAPDLCAKTRPRRSIKLRSSSALALTGPITSGLPTGAAALVFGCYVCSWLQGSSHLQHIAACCNAGRKALIAVATVAQVRWHMSELP